MLFKYSVRLGLKGLMYSFCVPSPVISVGKHESRILRKWIFEHFCTDDCVKGRGRFYQGTVNRTKQGLPCQHWDSQVPHSHYRPPDVFPEVQNAENYCRNAGGEEPSPWCYTMDPNVRWQRCDIPICGKCCCRINSRCMKCSVGKIVCEKVYVITLAMVVMYVHAELPFGKYLWSDQWKPDMETGSHFWHCKKKVISSCNHVHTSNFEQPHNAFLCFQVSISFDWNFRIYVMKYKCNEN